mgnify:CR=1 FL=1
MKWFYDLKIGVKLILAFIFVSMITAFIGFTGLSNMSNINGMLNSMYENELQGISYLKEANVNLIYFGRAQNNFLLASSTSERERHLGRMGEYEKQLKQFLEKAKPLIHTDQGKELFAEFDRQWKEYSEVVDKVIELGKSEDLATKRQSVELAQTSARAKSDLIDTLLTRLARMKEAIGKEAYDQSDVAYAEARNYMIIMIIGAMFAGIGFGIFISRIISKPIIKGVEFAKALSEGDLTQRIDIDQKDEVGQLANALNLMVDRLKEVVEAVKGASDNVASGSQQLSSSSEQMSQGATEQAAAAEEASSSMEQMTSNIKQNADNAQQTEKIALKSSSDASEGGKAVTETAEAMKEIAGKISIIEEIARQTNLLALNAAIEAARAGEHGKGFAVVASEVRKLAERSQTAAAEINTLSASSIKVAEKAGDLLKRIVPDIQRTSELVQEITAASNEQNSGAEQINSAIQQLNQVIQQNASASEELSSTAEELTSQSEQLQETMSFFKLDEKGKKKVTNRRSEDSYRVKSNDLTHEKFTSISPSIHKPGNGSSKKNSKLTGVVLDMGNNGNGNGHGDKLDHEFERF